MCRYKDTNIGIKKLNFTEKRGMMVVYLTDGRVVMVPVNYFRDIQQMPVKERSKWYILDDQYFTFENMTRVYSVKDVLNYDMVQH